MSPKRSFESDVIRVRHMIDAIDEALSFIEGKTRDDLANDRMCTLSLIKEIEIIGEAASKVSDEFRAKYDDIPWAVIVGIRNRLIHGYFDVDLDIVWKTVAQNLPPLVQALKKIIV